MDNFKFFVLLQAVVILSETHASWSLTYITFGYHGVETKCPLFYFI